tara:strand:- start:864 stop:2297 length:1434 start_codon:yes stop_codon:yes gene_type:complete
MKLKYLFLSFVLIAFTGCDADLDSLEGMPIYVDIDSGDADFERFVAVGASVTAGYTDNALFQLGQMNSYPNIMAGVMAHAGGGNFTQPYMDDNVGGLLLFGNQIQGPRLFFNGAGPAPVSGTPTTEVSNVMPGPHSNLAVPGARAIHFLAPGYGSLAGFMQGLANPYYVRMASSDGASVVGDALAQAPTFVALWSGGNDALGFATSGGTSSLTTPGDFDFAIGTTMAMLASSGADGIIVNIPDVTSIAFLNTVPYNSIPLDDATAQMLNGGFAAYNGGLQVFAMMGMISAAEAAARTIVFAAGQNAVTIEDSDLTDLSFFGVPSYRMATADDKLVLTSMTFLGTTVGGNPTLINGVSVPLADNWVLTANEVAEAQAAISSFNGTIQGLASQYGWAHWDANAVLNQVVTQGYPMDDFVMTGDFVMGGLFSLDGVHPTARGNALIAKLMLAEIDAHYGSNLSDVHLDVGDYPTNYPDGL